MPMQRMRHCPDIVERRGRNWLGKICPAAPPGAEGKIENGGGGGEAFGDALDLALAHLDQIVVFIDAEHKSAGEEASDDGQYAILVDATRPLLDPFENEAFAC